VSTDLSSLLSHPELFVRQRKEWVEILVDWETRNQYSILDADGAELGLVVERAGGLWDMVTRWFLRSHRPLEAAVVRPDGAPLWSLRRPFFWLFSHLEVTRPDGGRVGDVSRRFGVLYKRYDLSNGLEVRFARIASPRWRLWTFPVEGAHGQTATISKKWSGALREVFSDADTFRIEFGNTSWTEEQRAVILAAAISIDFDFFENNQGSGGLAFDVGD
jgi:uncharacterized protein YxjI